MLRFLGSETLDCFEPIRTKLGLAKLSYGDVPVSFRMSLQQLHIALPVAICPLVHAEKQGQYGLAGFSKWIFYFRWDGRYHLAVHKSVVD